MEVLVILVIRGFNRAAIQVVHTRALRICHLQIYNHLVCKLGRVRQLLSYLVLLIYVVCIYERRTESLLSSNIIIFVLITCSLQRIQSWVEEFHGRYAQIFFLLSVQIASISYDLVDMIQVKLELDAVLIDILGDQEA